jgi:hypothetical protein
MMEVPDSTFFWLFPTKSNALFFWEVLGERQYCCYWVISLLFKLSVLPFFDGLWYAPAKENVSINY